MQTAKLRCASQMRITDPAETPPHSSQRNLLKEHTCQLNEGVLIMQILSWTFVAKRRSFGFSLVDDIVWVARITKSSI